MKRKAIIAAAAFYLILATGMLPCFLKYSTLNLLEIFSSNISVNEEGKGKCIKLGFKLMKSSIKPVQPNDLPNYPLIGYPNKFIFCGQNAASVAGITPSENHAPTITRHLYILTRSLLI